MYTWMRAPGTFGNPPEDAEFGIFCSQSDCKIGGHSVHSGTFQGIRKGPNSQPEKMHSKELECQSSESTSASCRPRPVGMCMAMNARAKQADAAEPPGAGRRGRQ